MNTTVVVSGLNCTGCVGNLSKRILAVEGVERVDVALVPGGASTVSVGHDSTVSAPQVGLTLSAMGYTVV